jgi:predicted  nucleic acid-binding Zn-ribbon protein
MDWTPVPTGGACMRCLERWDELGLATCPHCGSGKVVVITDNPPPDSPLGKALAEYTGRRAELEAGYAALAEDPEQQERNKIARQVRNRRPRDIEPDPPGGTS